MHDSSKKWEAFVARIEHAIDDAPVGMPGDEKLRVVQDLLDHLSRAVGLEMIARMRGRAVATAKRNGRGDPRKIEQDRQGMLEKRDESLREASQHILALSDL